MATIRELISGSFRLINAYGVNEVPTGADMDVAIEAFNAMLDSWSAERLAVYTINPHYFQLNAGQKDYLLGPSVNDDGEETDADWVIPRPMNIQQAYVAYGASVVTTPPSESDVVYLFDFEDEIAGQLIPAAYADSRILIPGVDVSSSEANNWVTTVSGTLDAESSIWLQQTALDTYSTTTEVFLPSPDSAGITSALWTFEFSIGEPSDGIAEGKTFKFNEGTEQYFYITVENDSGGFLLHVLDATGSSVLDTFISAGTQANMCLQLDVTNNIAKVYQNGTELTGESFSGVLYGADFSLIPYWSGADTMLMEVSMGALDSTAFSNRITWIDNVRLSKTLQYTDEDGLPASSYTPVLPFDLPAPTPGGTVITENQNTIDIPMEKLNDAQYASISIKRTPSTFPVKFYDNGDYPCRVISVWPVPNIGGAVKLWLWEPLANKSTLDEQLAMPKGYERALRFNLAIELAAEFGKEVPPTVMKIATEAKAVVKRLNDDQEIMVGDIAIAQTGAGIWNWQIGTTIPN